jgi:hypothetical protein
MINMMSLVMVITFLETAVTDRDWTGEIGTEHKHIMKVSIKRLFNTSIGQIYLLVIKTFCLYSVNTYLCLHLFGTYQASVCSQSARCYCKLSYLKPVTTVVD